MLRIEMLPGGHGDCLWIEYGDPLSPHRVIVDGGARGGGQVLAQRVAALPAGSRRFELLVVTHVDADHIAGVLKLFEMPQLGLSFGDVWFNGYKHLLESELEPFGPEQGEVLSSYIEAAHLPWNQAFSGKAVRVPVPGALPNASLAGGLELTLLGPTTEKLRALKPKWEQACRDAGIRPGHPTPVPVPPGLEPFGPINVDQLADVPFREDDAEPNGSSISLLLRYEGATVLLGADAHPATLEAAIGRLVPAGERLALDAFKLPHHGSKANVSRTLLERAHCPRYLFSTNGSYFHHPDREAVARAVKYGRPAGGTTELVFNYRSDENGVWDAPALKTRWHYSTTYPPANAPGLVAFERP